MKKKDPTSPEIVNCDHNNTRLDGRYLVCQDCGLILDENIEFEDANESVAFSDNFSDSQREYERRIRLGDLKAKQDPKIKQKYEKLATLQRWYHDYKTSFTEQKKTIEFLKSYGIGLNIDHSKYQSIKERYLRYNKAHRKSYQNMVIIFLAIVWMEIKDTTNKRVDEFIKVANILGHKINKKMLNNAMLKVKKTENKLKLGIKDSTEIEREIKEKIKILFQKNLNYIPYEKVKKFVPNRGEYEKLKIEMLLMSNKILQKITYDNLKNLNYKAFTAGLLYYVGQMLDSRKIFIQSLIEETTKFSSTTIRKKYHQLKRLLGDPRKLSQNIVMQ